MIRNIGLSLSSAALIAIVVGSVWLAMKSPMHDRLWKTEYAQLPRVELDGDVATVRNVRNFSYDADGLQIVDLEVVGLLRDLNRTEYSDYRDSKCE